MEFNLAKCVFVLGAVLLCNKGCYGFTFNVTDQSIAENSAVDTTVLDLSTTVASAAGAVTYALVGTSDDFVVDSGNAEVRTKAGGTWDSEGTNPLSIVITADDTATTLTATLTVSLTDVDEAPAFSDPHGFVQFVAENAPAGTTAGTVTATDVDAGANGDITSYFIAATGNTDTTFVVSAAGVITVDTGKVADDLPYVLEYEARGTLTATTTVVIAVDPRSTAAANSIGIMVLVTSMVFQATKYL